MSWPPAVRIVALTIVTLAAAAAPAVTIHVSPGGDDASDGLSWTTARKTVQAALNSASAGDQVWVAAGLYVDNITLKSGVALYGGFTGTEDDFSKRDWKTNATILDGNQAGSVVTAPAGATGGTRIDGFTIRNGSVGINCASSSALIANNTIVANTYDGISCDSSPTIVGNRIAGNRPGITCTSSSVMIVGNTITGNLDAGIYCNVGSPTIVNTIIAFNSAGIYVLSGSPKLSCNCVYGNAGYEYLGLTDPTGTNGNISSDPGIAGYQYGGWHLRPDSPCVGTGDDSFVQAGWADLDGQPRTLGPHTDIGADESDGTQSPTGPNVIVRVSPEGNDAADGSTWATAKRTIQASINAAAIGGEVWVKAGTYVERIKLPPYVHIYGGFAGTESERSQRDIQANVTVLDAKVNDRHVGPAITAASAGDGLSTIDGFTIRNGQNGISGLGASPAILNNTITGNLGTGIYIHGSSSLIAGNTITGNIAEFGGGGISCSGPRLRVENNVISGNSANTYGGGISCGSSGVTIVNNTITHNNAGPGKGGGIYCSTCSPSIANNRIANNRATQGGGIHCERSSPTIASNTIRENLASNGGGISCDASSPTILNNAIIANTANFLAGGGIFCNASSPTIANNSLIGNTSYNSGGSIYCSSSSPLIANNTVTGNLALNGGGVYCTDSSPTIANTIIAFNSSGVAVAGTGSPVIRHNCVYANEAYEFSGLTDPTGINGNISADPKLPGTEYGNRHIRPDSPCIDAGDDSVLQPGWRDLDDQLRVQGVAVDIGADESDGTQPTAGPNAVVRVSVDGDDANDGSGWSQAKRTVQAAINAASAAGGEVWVKAGTYSERIELRACVHLYSGFAGTESARNQRDFRACPTILDGQQSGSVVTALAVGHHLTTIDGFTITNGKGAYGGGIYCSYGSVTIENNTIARNAAVHSPVSGTGGPGGGIYCLYSSSTIMNNTIAGNTASGGGGGISCSSFSPIISGNTIVMNSASVASGGLHCSSCSATVVNNTIALNAAYYDAGGAGFYDSSSSIVANNLIAGNAAGSYGGGIHCTSSSLTIANNTITGNSAKDGGGIYCYYHSSPTIANTVIAYNSSGICLSSHYPGTPLLRSNCVYGNEGYGYSGLADSTGTNGNIAADPKLADVSYRNLHIQPGSPCIDAGDDTLAQQGWLDMDAQARTLGSHVDIGADESDGMLWPGGSNVIVRVSPHGDDGNDGSSWLLAKRTVQAGIDAAAVEGGDVWIQAGTYVERISLRAYVHVYGGFAGTETRCVDRDWIRNPTVLDGSQTGSVVTAKQVLAGLSTIDGFTIRNGKARSGGGIHCWYSSPTIANNTIAGNTVLSQGEGCGIYCSYSSPRITNNIITGNTAIDGFAFGGGIYCDVSSAVILNNTITCNSAYFGGGIFSSSPITITNTIVAFNASGVYIITGRPVTTLRYNCVFGNDAYDYSGMLPLTGTYGNISADPLFVRKPVPGPDGTWGTADDDCGDPHLLAGSPCINAGDPAYVPADDETDMDAQPRKIGARVDIGADEYRLPGDVSFDGYVNVGDLQVLIAAWNSHAADRPVPGTPASGNWNPGADLSGDSYVNMADLQLLVADWGKSM